MSGMANLEGPLVFRATAPAAQSQYARIVELVRHAQQSKAPLQRLADRYAVWFTPLTLAVCAAAWLASGDAQRVLAVLVVATPCPLILAAPVAVIGGINRAARRQVIFRSGGALEELGRTTVAVFDKTGTLTIGPARGERRLDDARRSPRPTCCGWRARWRTPRGTCWRGPSSSAARAMGGALAEADRRGRGGRTRESRARWRGVACWSAPRACSGSAIPASWRNSTRWSGTHRDAGGAVRAFVAVDGALAGVITYADALRPGIERLVARPAGRGHSTDGTALRRQQGQHRCHRRASSDSTRPTATCCPRTR